MAKQSTPKIRNPHDLFFKHVMAQKEIAVDFLANYLPPSVTALIDLPSLAPEKDSFVDEELQAHLSDLLYRISLKSGQAAYVYLLFEHKSYPDKQVAHQFLRYMMRIWDNKGKLTPIVGIVLYHGHTKWNYETNFSALYEGPNELKVYWPDFEFHLVDLSTYSDEQIRGEVWLRICLLVLKHIFDETLGVQLPKILVLAKELAQQRSGLQMIETILRYVTSTNRNVTRVHVREAITTILSQDGGALMATLASEWMEEGIQKGIEQGIEQGIPRGLHRALLRVLRREFQPTEQQLRQIAEQLDRVDDVEQLEQLIEYALEDITLADFLLQIAAFTDAA